LLITDVVPGGMNGRQIANAARMHRPDRKGHFITGYADSAVARNVGDDEAISDRDDGRAYQGIDRKVKPS
jgi:hypothetical protein